jgi:hypothetical protein
VMRSWLESMSSVRICPRAMAIMRAR